MAKVLYNADFIANITTCRHCKSVIEYYKSDIRCWTDSDGPGGCGRTSERIDCPNCNRTIELD